MISNRIVLSEDNKIAIPVIVRSDKEGWIPNFELWETFVERDTCYIECTQRFRKLENSYDITKIDEKVGMFNKKTLMIY
ncbi:MAG: hypothetical protein PHE54_04545 [Bacilli bacterium]|nr:hypothetical protein [Bacilli bacterium]